jgi:hypothetical protein
MGGAGNRRIKVLRFVPVISAALLFAACAPQAIMSDSGQAVIGAWSKSEAVARAEQECGEYGRWPSLRRQGLNAYWFDCKETADPVTVRWGAPVAAAALDAGTRSVASPAGGPLPASGQGNWVQLGAFRERTAAKNFLVRVRRTFPGIVIGHSLVLRDTHFGPRGTMVLAHLGPYARAAEAHGACGSLKARGAACFVVAQR